jgi:hypothetical protein
MKISGYGSGSGSGSGTDSRRRREAFRRSHSVGQQVRGVVLRQEGPGLAWVRVGTQELLANIGADVVPGRQLAFRVLQLSPDIVLQALGGGGAATAEGAMAELAQQLRVTLTGLDTLTRGPGDAPTETLTETLEALPRGEGRRQAYLRGVAATPHGPALFARALDLARELNGLLAPRHGARLVLAPWLLPRATEFEFLVGAGGTGNAEDDDGLAEAVMGFRLPALGYCRVQLFWRGERAGYRLFLERPGHAAPLRRVLDKTLPADLACLGVHPLPPGPASPLASLFHPPDERPSAGLDTRV